MENDKIILLYNFYNLLADQIYRPPYIIQDRKLFLDKLNEILYIFPKQDEEKISNYCYDYIVSIIYNAYCKNTKIINKIDDDLIPIYETIIKRNIDIRNYVKPEYKQHVVSYLLLLTHYGNDNNVLFEHLINDPIYKHELISGAIKTHHSDILNKILSLGIIPEISDLDDAIKFDNHNAINILLMHKLCPNKNTLLLALDNIRITSELFIKLLSSGFQPDTEILVYACRVLNIIAVPLILDIGIEPTNECFKFTFYENVNRLYISHTHNTHKIIKIIKMLINAGYKLTNSDVCLAIYCGIPIATFGKIKTTYKMLETACIVAAEITELKKIIKQGAKPDLQCLQLLCRHKTTYGRIAYFAECGIKPDNKCLANIMAFGSSNMQKISKLVVGPGDGHINLQNMWTNKQQIIPKFDLTDAGFVEQLNEKLLFKAKKLPKHKPITNPSTIND